MQIESTIVFLAITLPSVGANAQGNLFTFEADGSQDQFGASVGRAGDVDLDGVDDVVVGAPEAWEILFASGPGYARVFSGATGSPLFTFIGIASGDRFGASVDTAGDVDNDGHADVVIGADQGAALLGGLGYVQVLSGSDGGLLRQLAGTNAGDRFGRAVSNAGDVNNDGTLDVIVGAPYADSNGESSGTASVFSGVDGSVIFSLHGNGPPDDEAVPVGDQLGISVDDVGDVNADGFDDVVVGSSTPFLFSQGQGNFLHVVSGATGSVLFTFVGDSLADGLGTAVAAAGDLDADGTPDVLAGAPYDSNVSFASGSARAFSGDDGTALHFFPGGPGLTFGSSVAGIGDANADGHDDVAIGGASGVTASEAVAVIYSGADGVPLAAFAMDGGEHGVRAIVGPAGDVDSDDLADVVIGLHSIFGDGLVEVNAPGLLAGAPLPSSIFAPGDTLVGTIENMHDEDDARFSLMPGAKVSFHVSITSGGLEPIVALYAIHDGQVDQKVKAWKVSGSGSKPLKFKSKKGDDFELRVRGSKIGGFEIQTVVALPDFAEGGVSVEKVAKKKVGSATVLIAESKISAFSGSRLDATITPLTSFVPTEIDVITPSDVAVPASLYGLATEGDGFVLEGVPLLETGLYRVRVYGGAKGDKVRFDLAPAPPPGNGLTIEID